MILLQNYLKFLPHSGLLIKDPLKRLCRDATKAESQVKSHAFFKSIDWNALEAKQIPPPFRPRVVREIESVQLLSCFKKVLRGYGDE